MQGHQATPAKAAGGIAKGFASATDTTTTQVIPAPGAGFALMITALVIHNSHATNGTGVDIYSGSTKIWGPIPAPPGNGGAVLVPLDPPLPCNENDPLQMKAQLSVTTISVSALGYVAVKGQS